MFNKYIGVGGEYLIIISLCMLISLLYFCKKKGWRVVFDHLYKYRYLYALILFIGFVIGDLNFSSMELWNTVVEPEVGENVTGVIIGKSRAIRSDEWRRALSQYMGNDLNVSLQLIGKPWDWGALFLSKSRALSWAWGMKYILLFFSSLECMFIFTKRRSYSIGGAILITFSPAVQWWMWSSVSIAIITAQIIISSLYYYLESNAISKKIMYSILLTIGCIGFIFTMYPPLQVPLGLICIVFMVYLLLVNKKYKEIGKVDILICIIILLIIITSIAQYIINNQDYIQGSFKSVYPGKRFELGGGIPKEYLYYYVIGPILSLKEVNFSNTCEVSSFITLFPFFPMIFFAIKNISIKMKWIFSVIIAELAWMLITFPAGFAKVTLMSYVSTVRMFLIFGLTITYFIVILLAEKKLEYSKNNFIFITVLTNILILNGMQGNIQNYVQYFRWVIIIVINSIIYLVYKKPKYALGILSIIVLVSGIMVNPVNQGIGAFYNRSVADKIQKIDNEESGTWVAEGPGSVALGMYLYGVGVESYNNVQQYMDEKWEDIDVNKEYQDVYNRFAHIGVNIVEANTSFKLNAPDQFTVNLSIDDLLNKTDIKYILSKREIGEYSELELIGDKKNGCYIYKVIRNN